MVAAARLYGASAPPRLEAWAPVDPSARRALISAFAVTLLISIITVRWQVASIPIRSLFSLMVLGMAMAIDPTILGRMIDRNKSLLLLIAGFALLGGALTVLNGDGLAVAGRQVLELHVQAALCLLTACSVISICGLRATVTVFVVIVGVSALFALLQFVHVEGAWQARSLLGLLNHDPVIEKRWYVLQQRAMGLSYTPVHFGTEICLAFAAFYALRLRDRARAGVAGLDPAVIVALVLMVCAATISGNRSPILGAMGFLALYLFLKDRRLFWIAVPLVVLMIPILALGLKLAADHGVRIASTTDGSAVGRLALADLGWRLFLAKPVGYGLAYDSTHYWADYWQTSMYLPNAQAVQQSAPHNYVLNMLGKYGVGMLLLLPLAVPRRRAVYAVAVPFIAYSLHELFHNGGPFQADFMIWYVFAMCMPAIDTLSDMEAGRPPVPWRAGIQLSARLRLIRAGTARVDGRPAATRVAGGAGAVSDPAKVRPATGGRWRRWYDRRLQMVRAHDAKSAERQARKAAAAVKADALDVQRPGASRKARYWDRRQRRKAQAHAAWLVSQGVIAAPEPDPVPEPAAGTAADAVETPAAKTRSRAAGRARYWEERRRQEAAEHSAQLAARAAQVAAAAESAAPPSAPLPAPAENSGAPKLIAFEGGERRRRRSTGGPLGPSQKLRRWAERRREEAQAHTARLAALVAPGDPED